MKCMRVESPNTCPSGGWWHFYNEAQRQVAPAPVKRPPKIAIDAGRMMRLWRSKTTDKMVAMFATSLGVTSGSIIALEAAYAPEHSAWAFPMCDSFGEPIGIRLRNLDGFKWAVTGSSQGIFLPNMLVPEHPLAFLPEGPTDTAALLSLGLYAIGRPTCNSGNDILAKALSRLGIHKVIVVADNDDEKKVGTQLVRPGIKGALQCKKELHLSSVIWVPPSPCKDSRDFVRRGGTRAMIEDDIKNKVWSSK